MIKFQEEIKNNLESLNLSEEDKKIFSMIIEKMVGYSLIEKKEMVKKFIEKPEVVVKLVEFYRRKQEIFANQDQEALRKLVADEKDLIDSLNED